MRSITQRILLCVVSLVAASMLIGGCATFNDHQPSAKLVVSYATLKVIEKGETPEKRAERAAKIHKIASDAKTFLASDSMTLELLSTAIRDQLVPLNLSPADMFLANALIDTVIQELQQRVGNGLLSPDQLYQVSTVLGWVIDATDATQFAG